MSHLSVVVVVADIEFTCKYISIECFLMQLFLISYCNHKSDPVQSRDCSWLVRLERPIFCCNLSFLTHYKHHLHSFLCSSSISILCFTFVMYMMYGLSCSIQSQYNRSLLYYIRNSFDLASLRPSDAHMHQLTILSALFSDTIQAIIWTNAEMLLIGRLGTNFSGIISNYTFSLTNLYLKVLAKEAAVMSRLNVLI